MNQFEKVAGRAFRDRAEQLLAVALLESPDSAPCSAHISFYRHPCPQVKGRTRSVQLRDMTLTSAEIWVTWDGDVLRVIEAAEAERLVADGTPVEFETVLAGKFAFTWKQGQCGKCGQVVISREGVFQDLRPDAGQRQDDLAILTQGAEARLRQGTRREHQ